MQTPCALIFSLQEFLKLVPGLAILPFSLYLAWKKLGASVSASYSVRHENTVEPRLDTIVLTNHKDKPLTVFSIHAVIANEITYEVEKFDPPIVLKALESVRVETTPYSSLHIGEQSYRPDIAAFDQVTLYLCVPGRIVRCQEINTPGSMHLASRADYRIASKGTNRFNDCVYNEDARFAVTYKLGSNIATAIVDKGGSIVRGWHFRVNMVPPESMMNAVAVRKYLESKGFDRASDWFAVDSLND